MFVYVTDGVLAKTLVDLGYPTLWHSEDGTVVVFENTESLLNEIAASKYSNGKSYVISNILTL